MFNKLLVLTIVILIVSVVVSFGIFNRPELLPKQNSDASDVIYYIDTSKYTFEFTNETTNSYFNIIKGDTKIQIDLYILTSTALQIFRSNWKNGIEKDENTTQVLPGEVCRYLLLYNLKDSSDLKVNNIGCSPTILSSDQLIDI